ncbi:Gfo/Idh/MocA family oxidoreductase [Paucisalibacillus sp. EB02]|uniref:Gfo/Idh/MocA family oxidoreductase n=1 Tax=Paucisalibacillus sp. EB02 TaxID=1347087 RepID=UPI0004B42D85|nr:Gfo/Idh/MocA family oxidoreductase [Paucisalibacillus sp. EB02]
MSTVNICLIGTGRAGMIHGRNYASRVSNARLIALCDPYDESLKAAHDELNVKYLYTDYKEALENPEIDAVIIVTPTVSHKEIALAAANAKKHIFCEKPLAMNEAECDEIIEAANNNNIKLQVGFMRRFDENFQQAKDIVDSGEIGDVVLVKSLTRGPSEPKPWMFDILKSNGPIGEVNSHDLDTLRWFTGSEVESIYSIGGNFRSPEVKEQYPDYYDTVSMNLTLKNGMIGAIDGAQYVQYGYDARVEILGTHGNITLGQQNKHSVVTATKEGKLTSQSMHSWTYLFREAYVNEAIGFVNAIRNNTKPLVTGEDGKQAVKLVRLGLESLMKREIVYSH